MKAKTMRRFAAAVVGTALALASAGTASADDSELVYLQLLNMRGVTVYNTAAALATGYRACAMMNYMNGADVAQALYYDTDIATPYIASTVVVSAGQTLCPWHDHTREVVR